MVRTENTVDMNVISVIRRESRSYFMQNMVPKAATGIAAHPIKQGD